ncbi:MAG: DNA adenine methylase, partial [Bacteroidales bacterium]|nr:DNA adenine methylase [Bacteroidales bacterium]
MKKKYGMPYMGSKDKILNLIEYIFGRHYDAKYFIDLFCGGGSVFHYALEKSNFKVIANDIDTYVIALFEEIIFNKSKEIKKVWYNWIDKDVFKDVITNCNNYPKWYVGFVKTIWSFGNSGKNYLFGKDIENQKKALHQALVFDDWSFMKIEKLEFRASDKIRQIDYKTNSNKRIFFMSEFKKHIGNKRFELEQLE